MSAPAASERELRRAAANLETVRGQMEALARQADTLQLAMEEIVRARETLEQTRKAGIGREVLVPIGANSFVVGQLKDADRVIVGIGSDVAIDLPVTAAVERLEARAKAIEEAERGLAERMAGLEQQADAQSRRVQELYERAQGAPPG
ncbi:MAG: prefoldin subunit alpha [Methanobacteriota archaeon]|nr:MAG: prefoldin subunit alpha [Euryarchaeota archaeon]